MKQPSSYRVAHVVGNLDVGGGQKLTALIAKGLHQRGVDVTVVSLGVAGYYGDYLDAAGVPVVTMGFGDGGTAVNWGRAPRSLASFVRLFSRERWDIVHTHMFRTAVLTTGIAKATGAKVLGTSHRVYFPRVQPVTERALSTLQSGIVVDSRAVGEILMAKTGIPAEKYIAIHNGIDEDEFADAPSKEQARKDLHLPAGEILIGCVAALAEHKGQRFLIEAIQRLLSEGFDVRLVLVGGGADEDNLRAKVDALGVVDRVDLLGVRTDLARVLSALDVLALPSIFEGFGIVQAEGMLMGLPVVATNAGGALEVVDEGETGFLVPYGDVTALTDRLRLLVKNPAMRQEMGIKGKAKVEREFTVDRMVDRYLDLYERVLSGRPLK